MTDIEKQISATKLAIQLCDKLGIDYTYGDRGCTLNGEPVPDTGLLFPVKILYKGYTTTPEYDPYDKIYYGKIDGIKDLVDYHAETVDGIGQAIIDCVDNYIAFCKEIGKDPDMSTTAETPKPSTCAGIHSHRTGQRSPAVKPCTMIYAMQSEPPGSSGHVLACGPCRIARTCAGIICRAPESTARSSRRSIWQASNKPNGAALR